MTTPTRPLVAKQFGDLQQQHETSTLGMWTFLVSEVMFFGSLLVAYTVYRLAYPSAFAVASKQTDVLLGTLNTGVLLTSSLFMAFAVLAAQAGKTRRVALYLAITALLGAGFLGIKGYEYYKDWRDHLVPGVNFSLDTSGVRNNGIVIAKRNAAPDEFRGRATISGDLPTEIPGSAATDLNVSARQQTQMFFVLYFFLTGLHALHLTIGVGWASTMAWLCWRDHWPDGQPVEVLGLYWHFVDMVWVFLYPLLYLAGRHG